MPCFFTKIDFIGILQVFTLQKYVVKKSQPGYLLVIFLKCLQFQLQYFYKKERILIVVLFLLSQRFNVAITRAQALLIVVGNPHVLCKDRHWNR